MCGCSSPRRILHFNTRQLASDRRVAARVRPNIAAVTTSATGRHTSRVKSRGCAATGKRIGFGCSSTSVLTHAWTAAKTIPCCSNSIIGTPNRRWPKLTRTRQREAELAAVALLDRPKLQSRSAMSWLELADTKKCTTCGVTKSIAEFALKDKASGRRSAKCRACQNEYSRDHYVRKREDHLRRARVRRKRDREICRHQAYEYLLTHPCVDCGETDPVVLDFDHRDRGLKRSTISRMLRECSWAVVAAEIARCDVRCANCHRRRTAEQFGWFIA